MTPRLGQTSARKLTRSMKKSEEIRLCRAARKGDKEAFDALWEHFHRFVYDRVHRFARGYATGNYAEDVAGAARAAFTEALMTHRPTRSRFITWLGLMVRRRVVETVSRQDRFSSRVVPLNAVPGSREHAPTEPVARASIPGAPVCTAVHPGFQHALAEPERPDSPDESSAECQRALEAISDPEVREAVWRRFGQRQSLKEIRTSQFRGRISVHQLKQLLDYGMGLMRGSVGKTR